MQISFSIHGGASFIIFTIVMQMWSEMGIKNMLIISPPPLPNPSLSLDNPQVL